MRPNKPRKPVTRYCAVCLRAIPDVRRAVIAWCDAPSSDPRPVAYCSDACRDTDAAEQAAYEAHAYDPGRHDWRDDDGSR